ncbi:MAG: radical SAM protein [Clostridia bacterium]|nr:radical SAM protein [Clostridia bacterium]
MRNKVGNEINYLKIAVTDRTNHTCKYALPKRPDAATENESAGILSFEEITKAVKAFAELGITTVELCGESGGEALLRKDLHRLVKDLKAVKGIEKVILSTNGTLLSDAAAKLKDFGLDSVNINIPSLKFVRLKEITGESIDTVVAGINAATDKGLKPVVLDTTLFRGYTQDEILDFLQLTFQHDYTVCFREFLPGSSEMKGDFEYLPEADIRAKLPALMPCGEEKGSYTLYKYPGALGKITFISPVTHPDFHEDEKISLSAFGILSPSVYENGGTDIREAISGDITKLKDVIENAVS